MTRERPGSGGAAAASRRPAAVVAAGILSSRLARILTPGIGVLVLSAWCLGVLNSHRRFFLSYVAPVLWNVAQIVVLVALGLLATSTSRLVQTALYAIGDAKGPAAIAAVRVVVAAAVGVVLMFQLDRIGLVGPGIDGLLFLERPPAPLAPLSAAARTDGALRLGAVGLAAGADRAPRRDRGAHRHRPTPCTAVSSPGLAHRRAHRPTAP